MKLTTLSTAAIALSLSMCAPTAHHATHPMHSPAQLAEIFRKKDINHDGYLSRAEFNAHFKDTSNATHLFNKKDRNGDNRLTEAEFATKVPKAL